MLPASKRWTEGSRKPVGGRRGPATVAGERVPNKATAGGANGETGGKAGTSGDPGARRLGFRPQDPDWGEDPEEEALWTGLSKRPW